MRSRSLLGVLLAITLLLAPAVAWAEGGAFAARYAEGTRLYKAGSFERAIQEFERAYGLEAKPALLYNLGRAHQQLGHLREALRYYEEYQRAKLDPTPRDRENLARHLGEVTALLEKEAAERRRREEEERPRRELEAQRPEREAAALAETKRQEGAAEAERVRRAAEAERLRQVTDAERARRVRRTFRTLSLAALSGAVVVAAGGLGAQLAREGSIERYNDDAVCLRDFRSRLSNCGGELAAADTAQGLAIAGFVTGGALALTAAVLLLVTPKERRPPRLACGPGLGGAFALCGGSF
jgi:tetratricopeptide (TPR) repeat protein